MFSHAEKFRLLDIAAAKKLPYGQDALLDFQATLDGYPDSAQKGEAKGGASSGEDAVVVAALGKPAIAKPKGPGDSGLASEAIWSEALRGQPRVSPNVPQQIQSDAKLAGELARHIAAAEHQAKADLQADTGMRVNLGGFDWS